MRDNQYSISIIEYAQKLNIYFSVLYMFMEEWKSLEKRLDQLLSDTENNVRYIINPFIMYLIALENLVMAIYNLLPLDGFDGIKILSIVFGKNDLLKHARKVIKKRKYMERTLRRLATLSISYALVGFQLVIPVVMAYDGCSLVKLILL